MREKMIFSQSSSDALAQVEKECETFKPTVVTCFFNNSNFMLTDYMLPNESVFMVLENERNELIFVDNLNCGYKGTGPSMTAQLLEHLGVEREDAQRYSLLKGFSIKFLDERYSCQSLDNFFVLSHDRFYGGFEISKYDRVNLVTRKVYMVDPQLHNMSSFFNALKKMQPVSMEYCYRKDISIENNIVLNDFQLYKYSEVIKEYRNQHINLIIRGNVFNLLCFVDYDYINDFVSAVYTQLFGRKFEGKDSVDYIVACLQEKKRLKAIFSILKNALHKEDDLQHHRINLTEEEQNKWVYYRHF